MDSALDITQKSPNVAQVLERYVENATGSVRRAQVVYYNNTRAGGGLNNDGVEVAHQLKDDGGTARIASQFQTIYLNADNVNSRVLVKVIGRRFTGSVDLMELDSNPDNTGDATSLSIRRRSGNVIKKVKHKPADASGHQVLYIEE